MRKLPVLRIFIALAILAMIVSCDDISTGTGNGSTGYLYRLGDFSVSGITYRVKMDSGYLFTMNDDYGLMVYDVVIPSSPEVLGYYSNVASDFDISGDYAFLAGDGLEVANITWFDDIFYENEYYGTNASDVIVKGGLAYLADVDYGLRILDVSDPNYIYEIGSYFTGREIIEIEYKYPYILGIYDSGMWIINVDHPQQPDMISDYTEYDTNALTVYGNYAYLATDTGITVLDISDVEHPQDVGGYAFFSPCYDVVAAGSKLFVAAGVNGIVALDISNPVSPSQVDSYYTSSNAWALDVDYDVIYAACTDGILILRFGGYY